MTESAITDTTESRLEHLSQALDTGAADQIRHLLLNLHGSEIADLLECFPHGPREILWELVDPDDHGEVLTQVNDEVRAGLIDELETRDLVAATEGLDPDDLADILMDLPGTVIQEVLRAMDKQDRQRLEVVLHYPEDSAGGLMNVDVVTVRADVTLDVVMRYLRMRGELPHNTDKLFVVDRHDCYRGALALTQLLTNEPEQIVAAVMDRDIRGIPATQTDVEVARQFENHDLLSAAVVSEDNKLLGRITIDDVVDVIREDADHSLLSMAGLDEEDDTFAPVMKSARRRALWLGINLFTAFLASWVIGNFQATIGSSNARWLMYKELAVSILNGLGWAVVVAVISALWFSNRDIGLVIAAALIINLMCAALAGLSIPFILKRLNIDPALAGSVILTTFTDVIGFMVFLGLGTIVLL